MKGGTFADIKKICEKMYHKAEKNLHKKIFGQGWTRTHVLLLGRLQKSRNLCAKCQ